MFQAVMNTAFSCIAFQGAIGDDIFNFLAYFGLRGGPRRLHFGHHGALISRTDFEDILGASGLPPGVLLGTFSGFPRHDFSV